MREARAGSVGRSEVCAEGSGVMPAWVRHILPAEYLYLSISVFPLETSIFLERLPPERERYKKRVEGDSPALALKNIFSDLALLIGIFLRG